MSGLDKTPMQVVDLAENNLVRSKNEDGKYSPYNDYMAQNSEREALAEHHHWEPRSEGLGTALINVGLEIGYRPFVEYQYAHDKRLYEASLLTFEKVKSEQAPDVMQAMNSIENYAAEYFKKSDNFHESMNKVRDELIKQAESGELSSFVQKAQKKEEHAPKYEQSDTYAVMVDNDVVR